MKSNISSLNAAKTKWPPPHRCENCGWWRRRKVNWFDRLLCFVFRIEKYDPIIGECLAGSEKELTARSYVCRRHTAGSYQDITPSLKAMERAIRSYGL